MVEQSFRSVKSILQTRPIWHKCDETIRGHVFCSFLALILLKELLSRLEERGGEVEWARLRDDLDALDPKQAKTFSFFADRYGGSAGAQSERYRRRAVVVCRVVGVP
jgi:hypothetical protein